MKNETLTYDFHGKNIKLLIDMKLFTMKNEILTYGFHGKIEICWP
jgi:hypothetical protein